MKLNTNPKMKSVRLTVPLSDQDTDNVECRICRSCSPELIESPCHCRGSLRLVHLQCLQQWLNMSARTSCEVCLSQVTLSRHIRSISMWFKLAFFVFTVICGLIWTGLVVVSTLRLQRFEQPFNGDHGVLSAINIFFMGVFWLYFLMCTWNFFEEVLIISRECSFLLECIVAAFNMAIVITYPVLYLAFLLSGMMWPLISFFSIELLYPHIDQWVLDQVLSSLQFFAWSTLLLMLASPLP